MMNLESMVEKRMIGDKEENCISGRDLWRALEVKSQFANWMPRNLEMFSENEDYSSFNVSVKREKGASVRKEYAITLNTAEHVCLLNKGPIGKKVRVCHFDTVLPFWQTSFCHYGRHSSFSL